MSSYDKSNGLYGVVDPFAHDPHVLAQHPRHGATSRPARRASVASSASSQVLITRWPTVLSPQEGPAERT